jgi:hypothetical protein
LASGTCAAAAGLRQPKGSHHHHHCQELEYLFHKLPFQVTELFFRTDFACEAESLLLMLLNN